MPIMLVSVHAAAATQSVDIKVFATYWPQWHATALNDYWFEPGYTDWQLLCNNAREQCATNKIGADMLHPLPRHKGGLGWYNLTDRTVRQRQAQLAREYGIYGFAIYHFWFARPESWGRGASWRDGETYGADMDATIMRLLDESDGEPDIPFYFVWANEAFVFRWTTWSTGRVAQLRKGDMQEEEGLDATEAPRPRRRAGASQTSRTHDRVRSSGYGQTGKLSSRTPAKNWKPNGGWDSSPARAVPYALRGSKVGVRRVHVHSHVCMCACVHLCETRPPSCACPCTCPCACSCERPRWLRSSRSLSHCVARSSR